MKKSFSHCHIRCISYVDLQHKGSGRHSFCYVEYINTCYERESIKKEDSNDNLRAVIMNTVGERTVMSIDEILFAKGEDKMNSKTCWNIKQLLEINFKNEVLFLLTNKKTSANVISQGDRPISGNLSGGTTTSPPLSLLLKSRRSPKSKGKLDPARRNQHAD